MLRQRFSPGLRWLPFLALAAILSTAGLAPQTAAADKLDELDCSLKLVPADASFYAAFLRNKEQIDAIAQSNAWAKLKEMLVLKMGLAMAQIQAANPETPLGKVKLFLDDPTNQELVALLKDMISDEIFVFGGQGTGDFFSLVQEVQNSTRFAPMMAQLDGEGLNVEETQQKLALSVLAENTDRNWVPEMVVGFRINDTANAQQHLAELEELITARVGEQEKLKGKLEKKKVDGAEYLTLMLDGEMLPWSKFPTEKLKELEENEGDADKVIAKLKKTKLVMAIGLRDKYLLMSVGASTEPLAKLSQGKRLIERKELKPLARHADKRLTSISYLSKAMAEQMMLGADDIDELKDTAEQLLSETKLSDEQQEKILDGVAELAADIKKYLPQSAPIMSYSFLTGKGIEGYQYNWAGQPMLDGSKPLTLLEHVGGNPMLAVVSRSKSSVEQYDLTAKWVRKALAYVQEFAVPQMDEDDRAEYEKVTKQIFPLLERIDKINREKLIPATADGQSALVIDRKLKSKQIYKGMPKSDEPLPVVEPAVVVGLSDEALFREALKEYKAVFDDLVKAVRTINPKAMPEDYTIPEPEKIETESGDIFGYKLPKHCKMDKRVFPNLGIGDGVAVISASQKHSERLLAETPLKVGGVLKKTDRPMAVAVVVNCQAMFSLIRPWVDYGIGLYAESDNDGAGMQAAMVKSQVDTVFDVLGVFRKYTSRTYLQKGAVVTHSLLEVQDIESSEE